MAYPTLPMCNPALIKGRYITRHLQAPLLFFIKIKAILDYYRSTQWLACSLSFGPRFLSNLGTSCKKVPTIFYYQQLGHPHLLHIIQNLNNHVLITTYIPWLCDYISSSLSCIIFLCASPFLFKLCIKDEQQFSWEYLKMWLYCIFKIFNFFYLNFFMF